MNVDSNGNGRFGTFSSGTQNGQLMTLQKITGRWSWYYISTAANFVFSSMLLYRICKYGRKWQ